MGEKAKRLHDEWGLRCCTVRELGRWLEACPSGGMAEFCDDAERDWCCRRLERGQCVKGTVEAKEEE